MLQDQLVSSERDLMLNSNWGLGISRPGFDRKQNWTIVCYNVLLLLYVLVLAAAAVNILLLLLLFQEWSWLAKPNWTKRIASLAPGHCRLPAPKGRSMKLSFLQPTRSSLFWSSGPCCKNLSGWNSLGRSQTEGSRLTA